MKKLELNIPENVLLAINEKPEEFVKDIKIYIAINLFKRGKLSLGKAIEFAEVTRWEFMRFLSEEKISIFNYSSSELSEDLTNIDRARKDYNEGCS